MKINKIVIAGIIVLALAGCSDSSQQETDPTKLLDAASETTTVSEISETTTVSESTTAKHRMLYRGEKTLILL